MSKAKTAEPTLEMPGWLDALGGFIEGTAGFWQKLGDLETSAHRAESIGITIDRPVYVVGSPAPAARSCWRCWPAARRRHPPLPGFPAGLHAPVLEPGVRPRLPVGCAPTERAHKDRILVTADSPEAMEEVLWMRFFPTAHETARSQVLDATTSNPAFERFYTDHLKKILLVRGGQRYLSKGNYNLTPFRLSAAAVSRRAFRRSGPIAALAHRLADEAAPAVLRRGATRPADPQAHAARRPSRVRVGPPCHQRRRLRRGAGDRGPLAAGRRSAWAGRAIGPCCTDLCWSRARRTHGFKKR